MIRVIYEGKKEYLPLLLLADEQEDMIDRYLDRGIMYILEEGGEALAECVVTEEDDGILEIQNLAVSETHQGKGYGRRLIEHMAELYADSFRILQVGTGDSPATVPFYEKCGFRPTGEEMVSPNVGAVEIRMELESYSLSPQ